MVGLVGFVQMVKTGKHKGLVLFASPSVMGELSILRCKSNRTSKFSNINQISSVGHLTILDQSIYQCFIFLNIFFFHSKHHYNLIQNIWKILSLHLSHLVSTVKLARFSELSIIILFIMFWQAYLKIMTYFSPSLPITS